MSELNRMAEEGCGRAELSPAQMKRNQPDEMGQDEIVDQAEQKCRKKMSKEAIDRAEQDGSANMRCLEDARG